MTDRDFDEMMQELIGAEAKRLNVDSREFIARHNEIMSMTNAIQNHYKKNAPAGTANTSGSE